VLRLWTEVDLAELLASAGLTGVPEEPFPTDGWSGATFSKLRRADGARFVIKRDAYATNWIARATTDAGLREAVLASAAAVGGIAVPESVELPYVGAARDGDGAAILMPDLSAELIAWDHPAAASAFDGAALTTVVDAMARLHATPGGLLPGPAQPPGWPWCLLGPRLVLLTRPSAQRFADEGIWVGERFLTGWDAFERRAPASARLLIESLSEQPAPLVAALGRLPSVGLHGDLKLSNVGLLPGNRIALIDWQMMLRAPIAVELGWFVASNVALLPLAPMPVLDAYREALERHAGRVRGGPGPVANRLDGSSLVGDWQAQMDLAWIVGLLLRGWRKGLDAEAGGSLASGVTAADDLAWWCDMAVQAADRRL
jgi:aminoglycoside phosphotransferase (APT) family kinase protein